MEDTGKRREFGTGAVRDVTTGKGWYAGLSPIALRRVALVLQAGATKYAPRNWEKGMPLDSPFDSAIRHMFQWADGDTDEDHLGHAMTNLMFLIHIEEKIKNKQLPAELANMGPLTFVKLVLKETPFTTLEQLQKIQSGDIQVSTDVQPKFPGLLGEK